MSLISLSLLIYFHIIVLSISYIFIKLSFSQIYLLWILFWKIWSQSNSPPLRLFIYTWANKLFWIILVFCFMMTWMIWLNDMVENLYWYWDINDICVCLLGLNISRGFPFVQRKLCQIFKFSSCICLGGVLKLKLNLIFW